MYKVRYCCKFTKMWYQDWRTWSQFKARREFGNAQIVSTHLDLIELWKFNWWKLEWELTDKFEREKE